MEATAAKHDDARVRKGLKTKAAKRRARAGELDPPEESPAGAGAAARPGALPRKETQATTGGQPAEGAQANFTDPESSIMKGADGFVQGYNAQLAVDEEAQVIVAQGVTDQPPDNGNLAPMIERMGGTSGRNAGERDGRRRILEPGSGGPGAGAGHRGLGLDGAAAGRRWGGTERFGSGTGGRRDGSPEADAVAAGERGGAGPVCPAQGGGRAGQRPDQASPGLSAVLLPRTGGRRGGVGPGVPVPQPAQDVPKPAGGDPGRPAPERRGAPRRAKKGAKRPHYGSACCFFAFRDPPVSSSRARTREHTPKPRPGSANPGPPTPVNPARQLQPSARLRPGKRLRRTDS